MTSQASQMEDPDQVNNLDNDKINAADLVFEENETLEDDLHEIPAGNESFNDKDLQLDLARDAEAVQNNDIG